jgi:hypothetical protein
MVIAGIVALIAIFPVIMNLIQDPSSVDYTEVVSVIFSITNISFFIIAGILIGLVYSFFISGAIGMAKEAITNGKTNLSHMMDYGKRKFLSVFGANIIVGLIMLVGVLFILPGLAQLFSDPRNAIISFIPGIILMMIYMLVLSLLVVLVNYAIVIDDLGAIKGVKKGVKTVWHNNKINVFVLWLLVLVFGFILGLIGIIPFIGSIIMYILMLIVFMPLTVIWWTELYLTISRPNIKNIGENI